MKYLILLFFCSCTTAPPLSKKEVEAVWWKTLGEEEVYEYDSLLKNKK